MSFEDSFETHSPRPRLKHGLRGEIGPISESGKHDEKADRKFLAKNNRILEAEIKAKMAKEKLGVIEEVTSSIPACKEALSHHGAKSVAEEARAKTAMLVAAFLAENHIPTTKEEYKNTKTSSAERIQRLLEKGSGYLKEPRSHGYLSEALRYAPIPNAKDTAGPLSKIMALGWAVIHQFEKRALDPFVTSILNSNLAGKHAHHLEGKINHQFTLDWLDKAGAVALSHTPHNFGHTCIFASTSEDPEACERMKDEAREETNRNTPLEHFLKITSLSPRGVHKNESDPLMTHTHICYDVEDVWKWLHKEQGMTLPTGGLNALAHGTPEEIQRAFPKSHKLENPILSSPCIVQGESGVKFEKNNEPRYLHWQDVETLLKSVLAFLYIRLVELLAQANFSNCSRAVENLRKKLLHTCQGGKDPLLLLQSLILQKKGSAEDRTAEILYYLYGYESACSSLDKMYPHRGEIQDLVQDLQAVHGKLSARAARHHYQDAFGRLANSASIHFGRSFVGRVIHGVKEHTKSVIRGAHHVVSRLLDFEWYLLTFKPVICLLGMVGLFFSSDSSGVTDVLGKLGVVGTVLHVVLGNAVSEAFLRLYDIASITSSLGSSAQQALYLVNVTWRYTVLFFRNFLPGSEYLWQACGENYKNAQFYGLLQKMTSWFQGAVGAGPVGGAANEAASLARTYYAVRGTTFASAAMSFMPLEAFAKLGARLMLCVQYISPNGVLGGMDVKNSSFFVKVLEVLIMIAMGNIHYVALKFLEFLCTEFESAGTPEEVAVICSERMKKYRTFLMGLRVFKRIITAIATGGVSELVDFVEEILEESASSSWNRFCIGKLKDPDFAALHKEALHDLGIKETSSPSSRANNDSEIIPNPRVGEDFIGPKFRLEDHVHSPEEMNKLWYSQRNDILEKTRKKYAWGEFVSEQDPNKHTPMDAKEYEKLGASGRLTENLKVAKASASDWYRQAFESVRPSDKTKEEWANYRKNLDEELGASRHDMEFIRSHHGKDFDRGIWERHHASIPFEKTGLQGGALKAVIEGFTGVNLKNTSPPQTFEERGLALRARIEASKSKASKSKSSGASLVSDT